MQLIVFLHAQSKSSHREPFMQCTGYRFILQWTHIQLILIHFIATAIHVLTFSNLLLWASGLPTAVVGHWWRAKWLKLTQWPCLSGPKMNWTGLDENDWTFLKHFLNTCGIESVWPRAAVSWVAFFNLGFQILQRFPDASDCEHEQKFFQNDLNPAEVFLNVSMMQLVKWMWLTPRVWLSRTCFLNSSWRFLNIISFSCEVLQGTWHSKMPNSQPYLQHPSTSFFRFLP